jgi:hypothetical protein
MADYRSPQLGSLPWEMLELVTESLGSSDLNNRSVTCKRLRNIAPATLFRTLHVYPLPQSRKAIRALLMNSAIRQHVQVVIFDNRWLDRARLWDAVRAFDSARPSRLMIKLGEGQVRDTESARSRLVSDTLVHLPSLRKLVIQDVRYAYLSDAFVSQEFGHEMVPMCYMKYVKIYFRYLCDQHILFPQQSSEIPQRLYLALWQHCNEVRSKSRGYL